MEFIKLEAGDKRGIQRMAALAGDIWREHYTPIIGAEQVEYMVARFQDEAAVAEQLEHGYQYYFAYVDGARDASGEREPAGYLSFYARENDVYLSKLYLCKGARGHGYSHEMIDLVRDFALERSLHAIELNVNRHNHGSIAAYEALGFRRAREERIDIGGGFFMDDYVYRIEF